MDFNNKEQINPDMGNNFNVNKLFELSLSGFFIMMLDEPVEWNDSIDKDKTMAYVFSHQRVTKVNKAMLDQYGYSESDFLNKTPNDLFAHDLALGRTIWKEFFDLGRLHIDTLERKADGSEMWIEGDYICIYDELGRITGHFGNQIDVTKRKQTEEALKYSEAKLHGIVNSTMDAVISVNSKQEIILFNPAAEKMFGYSQSEIINSPLEKLLPMPNRANHHKLVEKFGETGISSRSMSGAMDVQGVRANGEVFPIEVSISQVVLNGEKFYTSILRDITERKQAEKELIKAKVLAEEGDKLKSAFLANISHEIRTPLNGILGFISILNDDSLTKEERAEYTAIIEKSSARLLNIINDILDYSKIEAGSQEVKQNEVNVNEKIIDLYKKCLPLSAKNLVEFKYSLGLDDYDAYVLTDREKLFSALHKLVDNAFKFTKNGHIEIGYKRKGNQLEFYVQDSGVGIENDKLDVIFDKFRQGSESLSRDYDGAGLGLSIAKSYIELIGGKIWVESQPNVGSTFYISIPYNPASSYAPINYIIK